VSSAPIWAMTLGELSRALDSGALRSIEIVEALQSRADDVEPHVSGFATERRDEARREARAADAERAAGRRRGPLHGVPFTVKENVDVRGTPTTLGLRCHAERLADEDAVLVRLARESGMVLLGKSNVPQALVSGMECDNPLFGTTRNPWSLAHGPGGSSGGEAALVATGASPLGIGTDLGGSIRSPAAYCGIVGLKPTTHRWSNLGVRSFLPGQEIVRAQLGPMARSVDDLRLALEELSSQRHARYDPEVAPLPVETRQEDLSGHRVGYFEDDGFLTPAASVRRAVREAGEALRARGVELVPFVPHAPLEVLALYVAGVSSDGLRVAKRQLRGDTIADTMRELWWASHVPEPARQLAARAMHRLGEARLAALLAASRALSVEDHWALADRRRALRADELARWNDARIDAILCPASVTPAVPLGWSRGLAAAAFAYTARYNLVGFPAGAVPVTTARAGETRRESRRDRLDKLAAEVEAASAGLPVAAQIVGRPFEDHRVLDLMAAVESWARARPGAPAVPLDPRASASIR
jgi:fatty acid amide hydrolase